ncbi:MAG: small multi-drug export protein [Chloroflexota bacterium]
MEIIAKVLTVLGLGMMDIWIAIPTGLTLNLHPLAVFLATTLGEVVGALIILLLGEQARAWLLRRRGGETGSPKNKRLHRILERYGAAELGFFSPLFIGAPLGTALGLSLGVPVRRLLLWMSVVAFFLSALWTAGSALGLASIQSLLH